MNPLLNRRELTNAYHHSNLNVGLPTPDSSQINVRVEVEIPLEGPISGFGVTDTLEFDPDLAFGTIEGLKAAELKLVTENGMPLDVVVQVYLANQQGVVLDSLFETEQLLLASAPIDAYGKPTGRSEQITFATLDQEGVDILRHTHKMLIRTAFSSTFTGSVPVKGCMLTREYP